MLNWFFKFAHVVERIRIDSAVTWLMSLHCRCGFFQLRVSDSHIIIIVHSPGHFTIRKLLKQWFMRLYLAVWTIATRFWMDWSIMSWGESCSRCRMIASSPELDVVTTLRQCYSCSAASGVKLACLFCAQGMCSQMHLQADDIHLVSEVRRQPTIPSVFLW